MNLCYVSNCKSHQWVLFETIDHLDPDNLKANLYRGIWTQLSKMHSQGMNL